MWVVRNYETGDRLCLAPADGATRKAFSIRFDVGADGVVTNLVAQEGSARLVGDWKLDFSKAECVRLVRNRLLIRTRL